MKVKLTELNSGYKGEKRVSRFSPKAKAAAIIAAVLVFAFAAVFLLSEFGVVPLGSLAARIASGVAGDEKNFPLAVDTDAVKNVKMIGDNLIVVTTDSFTVYSPSGKEVFAKPHTYAAPAVSVNGDKAVVFDRGGTGFTLITDKKEVYSSDAENAILSAEYGKNENYALATASRSATSELSVYDKNNTLVFRWESAYDRIGAVALSEDGKYAGVAALGAENGDIYTKIDLFGFEYKEPLNTQRINGAAALDIEFTGGTELTLISNDGIYRVKRSSDIFEIVKQYYSSEFTSFDANGDGKYAVALAKYGSANLYEITVFNKNGKAKASISVDKEIKSIYMSDKYIFALASGEILVYNFSGGEVSSIAVKGEPYGILASDDFVFIPSLDNISRCYSFSQKTVSLTD